MSQHQAFIMTNFAAMSSLAASSPYLNNWFDTDDRFQHLYPPSVRSLSTRHWTPLHITRRVAQYLTPTDNVKVLDIGSGVGKFCMAAAHFSPSGFFYGVEQRKDLVGH